MSVIFQVRGTSLDAYYARFNKKAGLIYGGNSAPTVVADGTMAGLFGGSYIQKANANSLVRGLVYPGFTNTWDGTAFSLLWRIIPRWTGLPTTIYNLVSIAGYSGSGLQKVEVNLLNTGKIRVRLSNTNQSTLALTDSTAVSTAFTSGVPMDIMLSWAGSTAAGNLKLSIDGTEFDTLTMALASPTPDPSVRTGIVIGAGVDTNHSNYDLNEFVIFNSAENHVYSPRTDFYTAPASGDRYPTAGIIKLDQTVPQVHSFTDLVGTYDATERYSDPGTANVVSGVQYQFNSTSNNRTGTKGACSNPGVSNVRRGTNYTIDGTAYTGTLYAPPTAATRDWAPTDTQFAIYNHLASDDTLITLLGEDASVTDLSTKVVDHVPDTMEYPFVVMEISPFEDRGNYTTEGLEATLTIHTWYRPGASSHTGRGDKKVQEIQKRIDEILHKSQMEITGWRNLNIRRTLIDILTDTDNVTRHGIQQFKLLLGGD